MGGRRWAGPELDSRFPVSSDAARGSTTTASKTSVKQDEIGQTWRGYRRIGRMEETNEGEDGALVQLRKLEGTHVYLGGGRGETREE